MKKYIALFFSVIFLVSTAIVQAQQTGPLYVPDGTISIPGNGGHDYLFVNQPTRTMYVTHGTSVAVIDLDAGKYTGVVDGLKGDHGVAVDNALNRGFVSDGENRSVLVFDTKNLKTLKNIGLKGKDEDAIILDSASGNVFVFDGDSHQAEVIDPKTLEELGVIPLGAKPEFAVSNGKGMIYNNLESANKIAVIDASKKKVDKEYSLGPCKAPTGMALDKTDHRIFTGCRGNKGMTVVNAQTGDVIQTLPIGNGVDAVKYDPGTHLIFVSCFDGTVTIVKQQSQDSYTVVQTLHTQRGARTMAVDTKTHKIYLSVSDHKNGDYRQPVPNSFKVLVYKMRS